MVKRDNVTALFVKALYWDAQGNPIARALIGRAVKQVQSTWQGKLALFLADARDQNAKQEEARRFLFMETSGTMTDADLRQALETLAPIWPGTTRGPRNHTVTLVDTNPDLSGVPK